MKFDTTLKTLVLAATTAVVISTPAQATLVARDIANYGVAGVTDAFYDTDLNITWLRDANINGQMTFDTAKSWADQLVIGAFSDWRLPTSVSYLHPNDPICTSYNCIESEMGHLFYTELGSTAPHFVNTGSFLNVGSSGYWSGTEKVVSSGSSRQAFAFTTQSGSQYTAGIGERYLAMAVHQGDVLAVTTVPEPETYALLLAGLGMIGGITRRRAQKNTTI